MAKWYIKFNVTHVQCPNKLVGAIRSAFNELDGHLLPDEESKKATVLKMKEKVKELNIEFKRCKPVDTWERQSDHRILNHSLNSYHVGSLIFYPVKMEICSSELLKDHNP